MNDNWHIHELNVTFIVKKNENLNLENLFQALGVECERETRDASNYTIDTSYDSSARLRININTDDNGLGFSLMTFRTLEADNNIKLSEREKRPKFNQYYLDWSKNFIEKFVGADLPGIHRCSVTCVLLQNCPTRESGYEILSKMLSFCEIDIQNSRNFSYSINRPRQSSIDGQLLEFNRISTWKVIPKISLNYRNEKSTSSTGFQTLLEVQINNEFVEDQTLPKNSILKIFTTMLNMVKEISVKGDIK